MRYLIIAALLSLGCKEQFDDYAKKSKRSEAELNLNRMGKSLKVYILQYDKLPAGKAGPTPAAPCCSHPPKYKCPPDAAQWQSDPIWKELEFQIDELSYYQYTYESDGKTFTATAIGDLDCDSQPATFTLTGSTDMQLKLTPPPKGEY